MSCIIYLMGITQNISSACAMTGIAYGLLFTCTGFLAVLSEDKPMLGYFKKIKSHLWCFLLLVAVAVFLPNSKTIAAMYLLPKITSNESFDKIPDKTLQLLNKKLDEWLEAKDSK